MRLDGFRIKIKFQNERTIEQMTVEDFREAIRNEGGHCGFIDKLSDERLDWLVTNPPLGDDLIDHGLECRHCASRIARVVRMTTRTRMSEIITEQGTELMQPH